MNAATRIYVTAFLTSAAVSLLAVPVACRLAMRFGFVDPAGGRKAHRVEVPRVGGVGMALGLLCGVLAARFLLPHAIGWSVGSRQVLLGALLCFLVGLGDDLLHKPGREGLPALVKLPVQLLAAALVAYVAPIKAITLPGDWVIEFHWGLQYAVTVLFIVTITNSMNFIDGMDGLAGGVGLIAAACLAVCGIDRAAAFRTQGEAVLALALMGALIGFLRLNFPPAKVFMGDGGALMLGFVLAATAVSGLMKGAAILALVAPFIILALPFVDLTHVVVRRVLRGQNPMQADRTHLPQRLQDAGWSVYSALLFTYAICGLCGSAALSLLRIHGGAAVVSLGVALLLVVVAVKRPRADQDGAARADQDGAARNDQDGAAPADADSSGADAACGTGSP
jgi:UDP-GlcNAc:undecaprenyl-phosphate GlcNAc-1-phosphate transferase